MMKTIQYLFDPLCGWCYAVSPFMQKLSYTHHITLTPTGLFSKPKQMDEAWAQHAWENDQRIQKLTGQPFSEKYRTQILQQPTQFNSLPLVIALTAVQNIAPERELSTFIAFQTARYVDGMDTADMAVLATILRANQLEQAADLLHDSQIIAQAQARIESGRKLAAEWQINGVPSVFEQTESGWQAIPMQTLLGAS